MTDSSSIALALAHALSRGRKPAWPALAAAALLLTGPAWAQTNPTAHGLAGTLGAGAASVPTYQGSATRRTVAAPELSLSYRSRDWGSVELGTRGLMWQAFEANDFRLGLVLGVDLGRKAREVSGADPTPGDKRLAGMGDIRASAEAGISVGYGPVMLLTRQSLGERGHQGFLAELSIELPWAATDRIGLRASASATWTDQKYQQAYFGVTAAQARRTAFRAFTPQAGLRSTEISLGAEYKLNPATQLRANVAFSRLGGDAAESPLVQRKLNQSAFIGVVYAF